MTQINWKNPPYNHAGRWSKKFDSIMNPTTKITFPQLIAEFVVYWRCKFIKNYNSVKKGPDWHKAIPKDVRNLNQQAHSICNYFPHPDDEPLVVVAFKNVFRNQRVFAIGGFRKNRTTKDGNIAITQAEKDILNSLTYELNRLVSQRNIFLEVGQKIDNEVKKDDIKYSGSNNYKNNKKSVSDLMKEEKDG